MSDHGVPEMEPNPDLGRPRPMCRTCGQVARCEYHIGVDDGYAAGRAFERKEMHEERPFIRGWNDGFEEGQQQQLEADCAFIKSMDNSLQMHREKLIAAIRAAFDEKLKEASHE